MGGKVDRSVTVCSIIRHDAKSWKNCSCFIEIDQNIYEPVVREMHSMFTTLGRKNK